VLRSRPLTTLQARQRKNVTQMRQVQRETTPQRRLLLVQRQQRSLSRTVAAGGCRAHLAPSPRYSRGRRDRAGTRVSSLQPPTAPYQYYS
jgi:hypothetical protein